MNQSNLNSSLVKCRKVLANECFNADIYDDQLKLKLKHLFRVTKSFYCFKTIFQINYFTFANTISISPYSTQRFLSRK